MSTVRGLRKGALALALAIVPAAALAEGDAANGAALAAEKCGRCHDVSREGAFKSYPPSFASIAVFRDPVQIRSRIIFPQLHSGMPQTIFEITPDQIGDLTAYIVSLDAAPQ